MVKYIIILLDTTSTSYCHYKTRNEDRKLISIEDLKAGIFYAMKENLSIQFVYPDYNLPDEYYDAIDTIDHVNIVPAALGVDADVVVFEDWVDVDKRKLDKHANYIVRTSLGNLVSNKAVLEAMIKEGVRVNVVLTDVETMDDKAMGRYHSFLDDMVGYAKKLYANGQSPQLNILTDRMMLDKMNNCNAGWESITLAPNGKFYVCPAFYYDDEKDDIGDLEHGLKIKNPQLYRLDHAPICRHCDAFQCRRCIWLNKKTTLEVNTPSHEQCVLSHLERNASRELLIRTREVGEFLPGKEIKEIDYLDPFEKREDWI